MAAVFEHPQHSSNIGNTSNMSNKHEQHHQQSGKCHLPMHPTLDGIVAALLFGLTDTFVTHYCRRFMCDVFISSVVSLKLFLIYHSAMETLGLFTLFPLRWPYQNALSASVA